MKIVISDEDGRGMWAINVEASRPDEEEPTPFHLAAIFSGLLQNLLRQLVIEERKPTPEPKRKIMLPGRDFPRGGIPQ